MIDSNNWYIEYFECIGLVIGYCIIGKLDEVQLLFQKIEIFQIIDWGNLMIIDGVIMLISKDNFFYYEMISYLVLFIYVVFKCVVIIGGGDCGILCEVFKYIGVESVIQCDIDEQVIVMVCKYFLELCDFNDDVCVELLFDDGVVYMVNCLVGSVDVVIVDLIDLVGLGEGLFNKVFYESCFKVLKDDGILVQQFELLLMQLELINEMCIEMGKVGFGLFKILLFLQLCYFIGWWSVIMVCKGDSSFDFCQVDLVVKIFNMLYYIVVLYIGVLVILLFVQVVLKG